MKTSDEILVRVTAAAAAAKWRQVCLMFDQADWLTYDRTGTISAVPVIGARPTMEKTLSELRRDALINSAGATKARQIGPTPLGCRRALEIAGFDMTAALRFCWRLREAERYTDKAGIYIEASGAIRVDSWVLDPETLGRSWHRPQDVTEDAWADRMRDMFLESMPAMLMTWLDVSFCGGGWLIFLLTDTGRMMLEDPALVGHGVKPDSEARELFLDTFDIEAQGAAPTVPDCATPATVYFGDAPPPIPEAPTGWPPNA